jgi:hypothetical protein
VLILDQMGGEWMMHQFDRIQAILRNSYLFVGVGRLYISQIKY